MTRPFLLSLLLLSAASAWAQPCEATPEVRDAFRQLSRKGRQESVSLARQIREKFPTDYFAHQYYLTVNTEGFTLPPAVRDDYRALSAAHPDDPMFLTLYARSLTGFSTPQAIPLLSHALELQPGYPPAHLQLALIHDAPNFADPAQVVSHLQAYWKACPNSTGGYAYVSNTRDNGFIGQSAARLRSLLEKRRTPEDLAMYGALWTLEFKVTPLSRQPALRDQVRLDAQRLRPFVTSETSTTYYTLNQAYKLLGDSEGARWLAEHRPANEVTAAMTVNETIMNWRTAHPVQSGEREQYNAAWVKTAGEWIRKWPDQAAPYQERFNALMANPDTPQEDQVAAAEDWLRVYEANRKGPAPYLALARFYSARNLHYAQLPDLLEKGLKDLADAPTMPVSDLRPVPGMRFAAMNWSAWNDAAGAYLKIKRPDDARKILQQFNASLKENKPPDTATDSDKRQYRMYENGYWNHMAKLAHAENQKLDEIVYLRNAGLSSPSTGSGQQPYAFSQALQLWKELGGTDSAFDLWLAAPNTNPVSTRPAEVSTTQPWTKVCKPLPPFQLSDAAGKDWSLETFKGKVTLVNLWATWCGPCINELPYLQKLYDKVRGRQDIQVVTLNVDDNPGLIVPFLADNKYTFPVLPAKPYVDNFLGHWSIPRNWLIDSSGTLVSERIGFGMGDDKWIDQMIRELEKAVVAKSPL